MEYTNSSIFVQAKIEYTKQLIDHIQSYIFDGVKSIYDDSKDLYKENSSSSILFIFRTLLEKVPEWNNEIIVNETDRIIEESKCDYLEDLLTAVFVSHTKILMSISVNTNGKINLVVPKLSNFIHKCYINIARNLWKNPLLFSENISGLEYQTNIKTIELIICEGIENTIRLSLPVKDIIKGQLDLHDKGTDGKEVVKEGDNTLLLNKLKELLNLKDDSESVDGSPKEIVEGNYEDNSEDVSKSTIEIIKEEDIVEPVKYLEPIEVKPNNPDSGYDSPGEETIDRNCKDLYINDIEEVVVDKNRYDNPEIIDPIKENSELYEKLVKIKQDSENSEIKPGEVVVSKISDDPIKVDTPPIKEPLEEPILSTEEKLKKEQEARGYYGIKEQNVKTSIEDVVIIEDKPKKDDDKETVDLFMEDIQKMEGKKEVIMNKIDESDYILFDDLE